MRILHYFSNYPRVTYPVAFIILFFISLQKAFHSVRTNFAENAHEHRPRFQTEPLITRDEMPVYASKRAQTRVPFEIYAYKSK